MTVRRSAILHTAAGLVGGGHIPQEENASLKEQNGALVAECRSLRAGPSEISL